jgi:transcriptional regulator
MYLPKEFEIRDRHTIIDFISKNSFGLLVTCSGIIEASHIPFIISDLEPLTLWGHLAVGNDQIRGINGKEVLVIFGGPHAYISPEWYAEPGQVPTWDYTTVHFYGILKLTTTKENTDMLENMVSAYEHNSRLSGRIRERPYQEMIHGIVGFRIREKSVKAKFKLSQNHSVEDRKKVVASLRSTNRAMEMEVASLIESTIK